MDLASLGTPVQWIARPTRWSLVRRAGGDGDEALAAKEEILSHYWYPLYAWARRAGLSEPDAADAVQGFMERACSENLLAMAQEQRGRLRSFMLVVFRRHLATEQRRESAQKRGGGVPALSLDWEGAEELYRKEMPRGESPDALYVRAWVISLMEEAIVRLTAHYRASGRDALCDALLPALEAPLQESTYADVAALLGMTTAAVRSAAIRMRQRYRSILLELAASRLGITCEAALLEELRVLLSPEM